MFEHSKRKILFILHLPPPIHGASKVGQLIHESSLIRDSFDVIFVKIKSSTKISDMGSHSFKKYFDFCTLFLSVFYNLIFFRPEIIYFTASVRGIAFFRDLILCILWKIYARIYSAEVYFHYHTRGVSEFVSKSFFHRLLTGFMLKNVNLILLDKALTSDFECLHTYKSIQYVPNGVPDPYKDDNFSNYIYDKNLDHINVLFFSNMIREKGFIQVLELAAKCSQSKIKFHFAGNWSNDLDERNFLNFVHEHHLSDTVLFHGFLSGERKHRLFQRCHILVLPTVYANEAFPLVILEALSHGIPCLTFNTGAINSMVDENCGLVIEPVDDIQPSFEEFLSRFINIETALRCRQRYTDRFSVTIFEQNLVKALH